MAELKEKLCRAEDQAKKVADSAEGARNWAHSSEAKWRTAISDLETLQAACDELREDLSRVEEARVRAETKYSSAQVKILRISEESSEKVLNMALEVNARASKKADAIMAERIAEAKWLAV